MSNNNKKKNHVQNTNHTSGQRTNKSTGNNKNAGTEKSIHTDKNTNANIDKNTDKNVNKSEHAVKNQNVPKSQEQETAKVTSQEETKTQKKGVKYLSIPRAVLMSIVKIGVPVLACILVLCTIVSLVKKKNTAEEAFEMTTTETVAANSLPEEPLAENAVATVNEFIAKYYQALADGDLETIKQLKDYTDETELITYEKKSEVIESYNNLICYTKSGLTENSYFLYVAYDVKFFNIDTTAPGLNTMYVYQDENGEMKINGNMDETITAALKLVTNQDDVVDLFNKVDVKYKEATANDETLNTFLVELPNQIKTSVGIALAQLEATQEQTESDTEGTSETEETEQTTAAEEPVTKVVNEQVKAIDTVNVRSSDSEEADKIGKAVAGTTLTRIEQKINGWSKVIFEGKEAYIKSDYLEVVATEATGDVIGTVKANENVNVRKEADQSAEKLGVAQAGSTYNLLENLGEWYKIDFDGKTGFVKAEFFE